MVVVEEGEKKKNKKKEVMKLITKKEGKKKKDGLPRRKKKKKSGKTKVHSAVVLILIFILNTMLARRHRPGYSLFILLLCVFSPFSKHASLTAAKGSNESLKHIGDVAKQPSPAQAGLPLPSQDDIFIVDATIFSKVCICMKAVVSPQNSNHVYFHLLWVFVKFFFGLGCD